MNKAIRTGFVSLLFLFSACAITQIQRENEATELRISEKERRLQVEERKQLALMDQQRKLLVDLESKQMTLNELSWRLEDLQRQNAAIRGDNEALRTKKERVEAELRRSRAQVTALEKNTTLPNNEKQERIKELKKQISAQMKLMLVL